MSDWPPDKFLVTGDAIFGDKYPILILVPKSQLDWFMFIFFGLMAYASDVDSWYTGGETTPDEATEAFQAVWDSAKFLTFLIGMISDFAAPLPDGSGWLQCDGSVYHSADYPDLYTTIGTTYNTGGEPSGDFRVPDLRGRVRATLNSGETRLPSWADSAGGTGGDSQHSLTVAELASHNHVDLGHTHAESGAISTVINGGLEAPAPSATPLPTVTGVGSADISNTGSNEPFDIVQPTMAFYTYILAKF